MSHYYRDKSADSGTKNLYSSSIINNINIQETTINNNNNITINTTGPLKNTNVSRSTLVAAIDNLNLTKSGVFKDEGAMNFKKKIDKLNLKFYMETEKYLNNQNDMDRCQDQLFIILFKQISLYSEEVERLNSVIRDCKAEIGVKKGDDSKFENLTSINNNLRLLNKELESKLKEKNAEETKLKIEIESIKRQVKFYKDKLQLDLKKSTTSIDDSINVFNSIQIAQKKNISSDKIISLSDSKEKEVIAYKPTLSMNNFHKKNNKTATGTYSHSKENSHSNANSAATPIQVQISSVTEYFNSNSSNQKKLDTEASAESISTVHSSLTQSKVLTKKRNHSDNDPQLNLLKTNKELKIGDKNDFINQSKINLVTETGKNVKDSANNTKKPAVSLLFNI